MDTPQLSQGFFRYLFEDNVQSDMQPILQIIESRPIHGRTQYRLRLSDSLYSYSGCITTEAIFDRYRADQLDLHNSIIQVTKWSCARTTGKMNFIVQDYRIVSLDFPPIGNPVSHSGNASEHRDQMAAVQHVQNQNQLVGSDQNQWQNSPAKREPENAWTGSTKRARVPSPTAGDSRQPLTKRQPTAAMAPGIVPISLLTPYCNKWRICGIVSGKEEKIKEISNARGNFRVFGFNVTDQMGNAIRVSAFGDVADKIFPNIENGKVYFISGGTRPNSVKPANKQFNNTGHDYEITLDRDSEVEFCPDKFDAPKLKFRPVHLANVPHHVNECIDVQAIVNRIADITQVTSRKDQRKLDKRDVFLVDQTGTEICFTLWGDQANNFPIQEGTVIGVKGAVVKEFNGGFSISNGTGTQIVENPEGTYTQNLYIWNRDRKPNQEIKTISSTTDSSVVFERDFHTIGQVMQHGLDPNNEKGQYLIIKAMVNAVKSENAVYQACPNKGCKKKVTMEGNQYRCEKCNEQFDHYTNMIMLQVELADLSGTVWVTIFDEMAQELLGMNGEQLSNLQREDHASAEEIFNKIRFNDFIFRVRVRYETYNDQQQIRWNVFDVKPVPNDKCKKLYQSTLQELEQLYPGWEHEPQQQSMQMPQDMAYY